MKHQIWLDVLIFVGTAVGTVLLAALEPWLIAVAVGSTAVVIATRRTFAWHATRLRRSGSIAAVLTRRVTMSAAGRLTGLAVLIGGRRRAWRREEYRAILAAASSARRPALTQLRHGVGFVAAALVMRTRDLARPLLRGLDFFLAKPRTEYLAATAAILAATYFVRTVGFGGMLANLDNVLSAAAVVVGAGVFLRHRRDVPPVTPREKRR